MIEAIITTSHKHSRVKRRVDKFVTRFNQLEREPREVILAVLVGFLAGVGVFFLRQAIYLIYLIFIAFPLYLVQGLWFNQKFTFLTYNFNYQSFVPQSWYLYAILFVVLFSVTLGGAVVGYLNIKLPPEKGEHGIPQVINAVENNQGRLPYKYPLVGLIKSAITIGTAGAVGREGPVVQIGGGSGSAVGKFFRVTPEEKKTLLMAGVAGGISATFNAPLGGLMFSFELFRRGDRSPRLLPLLVSSVVGTAIGGLLIGKAPFLTLPQNVSYRYDPSNFIIFVLMGAMLGVVSVIWIVGYHTISRIFEKRKMSRVLKPALGGFILGVIYLGVLFLNTMITNPNYFINLPVWIDLNSGHFPMYFSNALNAMDVPINPSFFNQKTNVELIYIALIAFTIFIVALVGNAIILGSGGSGGQLAPTLLMGLMLGVVFTSFSEYLNLMGITIFGVNTSLLEILAMAAFFAGSTRLPMTAIILTAEISGNDFNLTIPLMFTVATAWIVSRVIYREDLFSISLKEQGIISDANSPTEFLEDFPVKEIMTKNVITVSPKDRIEDVIDLLHKTGHNGFPVVENDQLVGILTTRDFLIALQSKQDMNDLNVGACAVMDHVVSIVPECPIVTAIVIMNSRHINRLPVIEGGDSRKVVGLVTRADLNRASLKFGLTAKQNKFEESIFESDFLVQLDKVKGNN